MGLRSASAFIARFMIAVMLALLSGGAVLAAEEPTETVVKDLHYGEVLFQFYQQDYFTALTHLAAYREQGRVSRHAAEAELLQGGLMLSWGQHEEAGRIFERLLADSFDPYIRNRTWFYLGKVRYQRGHLDAAIAALENISAPLPEELDAERFNLLARLYVDQGRYADAAAVLTDWEGTGVWAAYARYNLGVAFVRMGEVAEGAKLLNKVGTTAIGSENREELLGLRDKANVALGFAYLQADLMGEAKPVLQRVRLNGPFSNKALLGAGWADISARDYQQALTPWLELADRDLLDSAVQESLLAVPYAFAELNSDPLAAQYYAKALQIFEAQIDRLDVALTDAGQGRLLNALLVDDDPTMGGWYWQLESLPDDDRTRYLYFTIADHRFHEGLKSYRDLVALNRHLEEWRQKLDAYSSMLETKEIAYAQRLPLIEERLANFDLAGMRESYDLLAAHSIAVRADHDVVGLATATEQDQWARLVAMEDNPAWQSPDMADQRAKQQILKGLLLWQMEKDFKVRVWRHERVVAELGSDLARVETQIDSLDAARASVPGRVGSFDVRIAGLEPRIVKLQAQLALAMNAYSGYLQQLAEAELLQQRERLLTYRAQARFALASAFDRMSASSN